MNDHEPIPQQPRQPPDEWSICCSKTNSHALKYLIQVVMGGSVMIFSMAMIVTQDGDTHDKAIYYSLLSGTLGYFLPHPSLNMPE
jgi:hypothetical protein